MVIRKYTVSLLFAVFLAAGMTTSVFAACTAQKDLDPVKNVTGIIHGMTEVLQTIHSMETAEKAMPALIACKEKMEKAGSTIERDMNQWMSGVDKSDAKKMGAIMQQVMAMNNAKSNLSKEIARVEKEVPSLNMSELAKRETRLW